MTMIEETVVVVEAPAMRGPRRDRDDMMTAFTDAVRDNPVPAALIGMGALWLFAGGGRMTLFGGRQQSSLVGTVAHGAGSVAHGASGLAQGAAQSVSSMGHTVASGVSSTVGGFAEAVSDTASRMGDYLGSTLHGVDAQAEYRNPNFSRGGDTSLRGAMGDMTGGLRDMFERHPVALGVAGLALGAAVAASLPLTATERDTLGQASEAVKGKLGEAAEQARDVAAAAVSEVRGAASRGPG
ncbi:hypothetical protein [Aestuariivirga litoralis]|nr:hypothetical protein [Aestuariivirga litoralis]